MKVIRKLMINRNITHGKNLRKKGSFVMVECNKRLVPLNVFWRRRLKDARIDGCVFWEDESEATKITNKKSAATEKRRSKSKSGDTL